MHSLNCLFGFGFVFGNYYWALATIIWLRQLLSGLWQLFFGPWQLLFGVCNYFLVLGNFGPWQPLFGHWHLATMVWDFETKTDFNYQPNKKVNSNPSTDCMGSNQYLHKENIKKYNNLNENYHDLCTMSSLYGQRNLLQYEICKDSSWWISKKWYQLA